MRYVIEEIGEQGGFGKINKAKDTELDRYVAIKYLDPLFKTTPTEEDKERFRREAKTLASLSHPNIPAIYDVKFPNDKDDGIFQIIFEWIEGINTRKFLSEKGVMSLEQVRKWFTNICSALEHAHNRGIIHRDIKPSNLIITNNLESCYLVDFGIALRQSDLDRITGGSPIGTPGYMSPEQERGEELDYSSDIYQMGIVLYECLAGTRPQIGKYKALNAINESIPTPIDELIRESLQEKQFRLASASAFIQRLNKALQPHPNFSDTLSQGSLGDIQIALGSMTPQDFMSLVKSHRILIMSRIKDLIKVDEPTMRNAVASLLSVIIKVSYYEDEKYFSFLIEKSINYGYEKEFKENWQGDKQLREALNSVALLCHGNSHKVMSEQTIEFIGRSDLEKKEKWYYHDLRILLQNLLANSMCSDQHAEKLGEWLEKVNELSHS